MADQNTPLQTRGKMGHPIETTLAQIFATSGVAASLGLVSAVRAAVIAGGTAGDLTLTGVKTTDTLALVLRLIGAGTAITDVSDLTSEFTITAANTINNTGGTSSAGDKLLVFWRS